MTLSNTLIFVSKRLQRAAAAVVCLMALQMGAALAAGHADAGVPVARVHIGN